MELCVGPALDGVQRGQMQGEVVVELAVCRIQFANAVSSFSLKAVVQITFLPCCLA